MSDMLAELRGRFLARCAHDRARLAALIRSGELQGDEMQHLAHSLAGAAGTFGFPGVSKAAMRIDDAFARHAPVLAEDAQALLAAMDKAREAAVP